MTDKVKKKLQDLDDESMFLQNLRKELRTSKDPKRKAMLKRRIASQENERSSRYYRVRAELIRATKDTDEYEKIKIEIKKYDRRVRGNRIKTYPPIEIGEYAATFVEKADQFHGILQFSDGTGFKIAKDAEKAWVVIRELVEAAGDGYVQLGQKWQGAFNRGGNGGPEELLKYIHAEERGRGGKGRFILKPFPHEPVPRYEG